MAEISKIKLPSGTTYDIKDATARQMMSGAIVLRGATTTALTDEATTNPIKIDSANFTAHSGDAVFYNKKEYVFDGTKWHEFGDMSGLGSLAYKNSATGSYKPEGTVSKPTFTGNSVTGVTLQDESKYVKSAAIGDIDITDGVPTLEDAYHNVIPICTPTGTVSAPTFTGTSATVTVKGTPSVSVSATVNTTSSGATFQCKGSVSKPNITVTATPVKKYVAASQTGGGSVTDGTAASWTASVSNEVLTIGWTANTPTDVTLPTFAEQNIVPSVSAALAAAPTFTGQYVHMTPSAGEMTSTGSFKPAGTNSAPTFTATKGLYVNAPQDMFIGIEVAPFEISGTVSQPTFAGTSKNVTVS